jgi:hypothetical protein
MASVTLVNPTECNKENNHKLLLDDYFPSVISELILLYVGKFNLQLIEYTNVITYEFIKTVFNIHNDFSLHKDIFKDRWDIIDDKTILVTNKKDSMYTIYNVKTLQIVKNFYYHGGVYCASDGKHIIFKKDGSIIVFDIDKTKVICTINPDRSVTFETTIINDIIYVTANDESEILKYTLSGDRIGIISFHLSYGFWNKSRIRIIGDEIVIIHGYTVLFFDLRGYQLGLSTICHSTLAKPKVTANYVCVMQDGVTYKYKRII